MSEVAEAPAAETVSYAPPGPVAAKFHDCTAFVRGLLGPVGSGKSSSCCVEIIKHTLKQTPFNGVRRARWAVIRNTYPELKSTTIKTWQNWFPENIAPMRWDSPITSHMKISNIGDGTALDLEVMFLALDTPQDTGKLRSLELTGVWINEASEVPKEIFDMATQRVGRFPPKNKGGPVHPCVILDTNPPDDDHWYYKIAEEDTPEGWEFFRQPGALMIVRKEGQEPEFVPNPEAENILNIPNGYTYYFNQLGGKTPDWIKVFVLGEYGTTMSGKPVYPEWRDSIHVAAKPLSVVRGMPILLGWDFGLTPACIIGQLTPRGQLAILKELVAEDMGIRQFAHEVVKPCLTSEFSGCRVESMCDPAGNERAQTDEKTCLQELLEAGIYTELAPANDFIQRREAVAYFLTKLSGGEPAFVLDPAVKTLRKGFNGGYRYERVKTANEMYRDRPVKDKFSHPHDALQYLCMKARGAMFPIMARSHQRKSKGGWT